MGFKDTNSREWYANYVASAVKDNVVRGYAGNVFKPANSVTRAEFIKMLIAAADLDISGYINKSSYQDIDSSSWYNAYFAFAKAKGILPSDSNKIYPNATIDRAEVAQILYKMVVLKLNGINKYSNSLVVSSTAAENFYRN